MQLDRDRLKKCCSTLFCVAEACKDTEQYIELCVILAEDTTDNNRNELRRTISVQSMGPRVAVIMIEVEKVYWLDSLPFVDHISAVTDPRFGDALRRISQSKIVGQREACEGIIRRFFGWPARVGKKENYIDIARRILGLPPRKG